MTIITLEYPKSIPLLNEYPHVPYQMNDFFKGLLDVVFKSKKVFIHSVDWNLEVNSFHGFLDVHIYKNPRKDCGQGTDEYREKEWVHLKEVLSELFPDVKQDYSWRFSNYHMYKGYVTDTHEIPGVRIFIKIGTTIEI